MSNEFDSKAYPFSNLGLVLKSDQALLPDGAYYELTNMVSTQEGTLNIRNGQQRLTNGTSSETIFHTIAKLTVSQSNDALNTRYIGAGESIYRATGALPSGGAGMAFTQVATQCADNSLDYTLQRFSATRYNAGTTGVPYEFFACPKKMLKDTGALSSVIISGNVLQQWGIMPPLVPAAAFPGTIMILPGAEVITGTGRINTTVSSVSGTAPGYVIVTPTSMAGILVGMLLNIGGGAGLCVVDSTTSTTFSVYATATPSGAITSGQTTATAGAIPGTVTQFTVAVPGAAFDGIAANGYDTDDIVHVSIGVSEPDLLTDLRLRVMVNNATGSDYYEKSILPSTLQAQASITQNATASVPVTAQLGNLGVVGPFDIVDPNANAAKAEELSLVAPSQNPAVPVWTEIDILKGDFGKVGLAGEGLYTWQNVVGFQIVSVSSSGTPPTVWIGSIYIAGGYGPTGEEHTLSVPVAPYDYLYTYFNGMTGAESNPCVPMIENNFVTPNRQKVSVFVFGTVDPQVTLIKIYRRGGLFADGLYRLVGYKDNPGSSSAVNFLDGQSDQTITFADILEFDNDPPVRSTLPTPLTLTFSAFTSGSGAPGTISIVQVGGTAIDLRTLFPSPNAPGAYQNLQYATTGLFAVAPNTSKQETAYLIGAVGANQLAFYFQFDHTDFASGQTVLTCGSVVGQACNGSLAAFDSIFCWGDPNNPHILYQSKNGRPEAFPVIELDTGIAKQVNVGSPSDPIISATEFNGEIVCMNKSHFYVVRVFAGQMQAPIQTPAQRGLLFKDAWCRVDNEIWYLSYDGIYSWAGGESKWRSGPIDTMFNGTTVGSTLPINMTGNSGSANPANLIQASRITMAYHNNEVFITYVDTGNTYRRLRYHTKFDRWSIEYFNSPLGVFPALTAQYVEPDTGNYLFGQTVGGLAYLHRDDVGLTDGWVTGGLDGEAIRWSSWPAAYTFGQASINKQFSDLLMEFNNDGGSIIAECFYNFLATADATDTFTIPSPGSPQGRRRIPESFQNGFGKEAYAMSVRFRGAGYSTTLYSLTIIYFSLSQIQIGRAFDWDDCGYPDDKRLYEITIEYDAKGENRVYALDTITGVTNSQVVNQAVQSFTLKPLTGTFTGPSWTQVTFPINDGIIAKKIRLRNTTPGTQAFIVRGYKISQFEKLPPDIVYFTQWNAYGYDFDKYAQQVILDVDTGGVAASVALYVDGAGSPAQTFAVTTTSSDRKRNITLGPNIRGKLFRMVNTPGGGSGAKYQLFTETIVFKPADRGAVTHTTDWDNMSWPYDKKLKEITFEYDNNNLGPVTMHMDIMTGIKGGTITVAAYTFVLDQGTRALQSFPFLDGVYVKQFRLYPVSDYITWRNWDYKMVAENQPADIVEFTEWTDMGWPCEKIARNLILNIDTGGVPATITLLADGVLKQTFAVTTTTNTRDVVLPTNSDLIGRLWKIDLAPGVNGKAQLYNWSLDHVREPCAVAYYDSYESTFGYAGFKALKRARIHYQSDSAITMFFYRDGGALFYSVSLPAHAFRDVEYFYFPAIDQNLNKSKTYRIKITSSATFKLYADSQIEYMQFGAEQIGAFSLTEENPEKQLPVASPTLGERATQ